MRCKRAALLLLWGLAGCTTKPEAGPVNPRLALQRFDNQGVETDGWVGAALGLVMGAQLREDQPLAAKLVEDQQGVRMLGAGRTLTGDYRRKGDGFELRAYLIDTQSTKVLAEGVYRMSEGDLVEKTAVVLRELLGAKPVEIEANSRDWVELGKAWSAGSAEALERFVVAHPGLGAAYPLLVRQWLAAGRRAEAQAVAARLPGTIDALSRADVAVLTAADGPGRLAALRQMNGLRPADPQLAGELAQMAESLKEWAVAAESLGRLTRLDAGNVDWWNRLGYAEAHQGKRKEAVAAIEQYRKLAPGDANALDSLGEVNYMNRNFAEAARLFDEQVARFPAFQNLAGMRKAAFAYANAGNRKQADTRFGDWMGRVLAGAPPSAAAWSRALWLARTGRDEEALRLLAKEREGSVGDRRALAMLHEAALRFGLRGERPGVEDWKRWEKELSQGPGRNQFVIFALLAQEQPLERKRQQILNATALPQLAELRRQLLEALEALEGPPADLKRGVFPLPSAEDGILEALLFRKRPLVIR
ncbi:MAG: tetratricopeptide repeat protein [Acidobacteriota bacterium]